MKYVAVCYTGTGFLLYFLCKPWSDGTNRWEAPVFDGPTIRRIAAQISTQNPAAVIPATVEVIR